MKSIIWFSVFVYFITLTYFLDNSYFLLSDGYIVFYSIVDVILTSITVYLVFLASNFNSRKVKEVALYYELNLSKLLLLSSPAFFYLFKEAASSAYLVFGYEAASRERLIHEFNRGGVLYSISSGFVVILSAFVFSFKNNSIVKLYALSGLLASMLVLLSRSELSLFLILTFAFIFFKGMTLKAAIKFSATVVAILFGGAAFTLLVQQRPIDEGLSGIINIVETFFRYRTYSFHLSEVVLATDMFPEKLLYPFFGYLSEKPLDVFFDLNMVIGSDYISKATYFGKDINGLPVRSNALFPWWPWFYSSYGFLGLVFKQAFTFFVLYSILMTRFYFSFLSMMVAILVTSQIRHPFLHLDAISVALFVPLLLDAIVRFRLKSFGRSRCRSNKCIRL